MYVAYGISVHPLAVMEEETQPHIPKIDLPKGRMSSSWRACPQPPFFNTQRQRTSAQVCFSLPASAHLISCHYPHHYHFRPYHQPSRPRYGASPAHWLRCIAILHEENVTKTNGDKTSTSIKDLSVDARLFYRTPSTNHEDIFFHQVESNDGANPFA